MKKQNFTFEKDFYYFKINISINEKKKLEDIDDEQIEEEFNDFMK